MALTEVITQIDAEIAKLQQARALLSGAPSGPVKNGRGRPKGSKNIVASASPSKAKRKLSPGRRKATADAAKKRLAEKEQG